MAGKALPIVNRVLKIQPGNADILLGTGIYSYYISVIPDEFPAFKPLLIFFLPVTKIRALRT
ncbi:MAG: hypothetical protein IPJ75_04520 [Ignavibacteriales bacterium]|nr:hypothetical protein [Ignavibacteriales bacterium]